MLHKRLVAMEAGLESLDEPPELLERLTEVPEVAVL